MQIKHLLLDADGVVIKTKGYFSQNYIQEKQLQSGIVEDFFNIHWPEIIRGKKDLRQTLEPYLIDFKWESTVDEFLKYWFESESEVDTQLIEYTKKLNSQLFSLNLATNQEKHRLKYFTKELAFNEYFDQIFASCNFGFKKPEIEFYHQAWNKLNQPPKETILFWDDQAENVEAAKSFGFQAQVYTDLNQFKGIMKNTYNL